MAWSAEDREELGAGNLTAWGASGVHTQCCAQGVAFFPERKTGGTQIRPQA